jgi:hypothetical protein
MIFVYKRLQSDKPFDNMRTRLQTCIKNLKTRNAKANRRKGAYICNKVPEERKTLQQI